MMKKTPKAIVPRVDAKEQKERLEEILLTATAERKKIEAMHLPDEPDLKKLAPRISNDAFHDKVGGIMTRFRAKIDANEAKLAEKSSAPAATPSVIPVAGRRSNWEA